MLTIHKSRSRILTIAVLAVSSGFAGTGSVVAERPSSELTVCGSLEAATVRIISGNDRSSGVVISAQGHVLTVAHGLHGETDKVTIIFHDGAATEAAILLKDSEADFAVLQFDPGEDRGLSPIPVSLDSVPRKNAIVFAAGYPGRERTGSSPVVRLGELLAVEPHALRSSCTLTSGDSGGPLINQHGELVGLHRKIGVGSNSNLHLPIAQLRTLALPVLDLISIKRVPVSDGMRIASPESLVSSAAVRAACRLRTVQLKYDEFDAAPMILGTLLTESLIVTKLSELTPNRAVQCRFESGATCLASVIRSDIALDAAILKLAVVQPNIPALTLPEPLQNAGSSSSRFQIVFAASNAEGVSRAGIVSRILHAEPNLPSRFGAVLKASKQSTIVILTDVAPNGSAASAGLVAGSVIRSLDGTAVSSLEEFDRILKQHQPGDWLMIESFLNPDERFVSVRLKHDPGEQFERSEFLDGRSGRVSERRSGFKAVFQHDIPISPEDCGGPLCDVNGHIIGINIARRARESSLALPIDDVLSLAILTLGAVEDDVQ